MLAVRKCPVCGNYFDANVGDHNVYCEECQQARDFEDDFGEAAELAEEPMIDSEIDEYGFRIRTEDEWNENDTKQNQNETKRELTLEELIEKMGDFLPPEVQVVAVGKPRKNYRRK